ncbi:hypothetical protein ACHHYP_02429 [Achlya hypogyna]|uniref:Secreted protein n=1 Tax=Achlya hypogyna TaxID=1202772 RepID=A0A1V9Z6W1_ACHHY|nr:hypothetical protein ACHHYP_02429 [Achlya hypogyna]
MRFLQLAVVLIVVTAVSAQTPVVTPLVDVVTPAPSTNEPTTVPPTTSAPTTTAPATTTLEPPTTASPPPPVTTVADPPNTWKPAPPSQTSVVWTPAPSSVAPAPAPAVTPAPAVVAPSTDSSQAATTSLVTTTAPPTTSNATTAPSGDGGSSMSTVVGVLGGIIGAGVLALGVVCVLRRRQKREPARDSTFWPISPPPAMLEAQRSPRKPSALFRKHHQHQSALASLDGSRSTAISDDILDSFAPNRRSSAIFFREDFNNARSVHIDVVEPRASNILSVGSYHIDEDDEPIRAHQSYTL